ncbi:RDD family protein [Nocardia alni]|uniref:RDD family protein n=1 Tax=Nocardia alni TaxID=2815723 RepID=UPI002110F8F6|nr:RDD family protein [Nocardia alni]
MNHGRHGGEQGDRPFSAPRTARGIETFGRLDETPKNPPRHGENKDPRYPSPRLLRWTSAFILDLLIHAGPMIAVFVVLAHDTSLADKLPQVRLWALISWPVLSFIDRTVVQRAFHSTLGKAVFGLVVIRPEDGRWPTFGRLVKVWLLGLLSWVVIAISVFGDYSGGSGSDREGFDFVLPAVRRVDVGRR